MGDNFSLIKMSSVTIRIINRTGRTIYYVNTTGQFTSTGLTPPSITCTTSSPNSNVCNNTVPLPRGTTSSPIPRQGTSNLGSNWTVYFWTSGSAPTPTTSSNSFLALTQAGAPSLVASPNATFPSFDPNFIITQTSATPYVYTLTYNNPTPPPATFYSQFITNNGSVPVYTYYTYYSTTANVNYSTVTFNSRSVRSNTIQPGSNITIPGSATQSTAVFFWSNINSSASALADAYILSPPTGTPISGSNPASNPQVTIFSGLDNTTTSTNGVPPPAHTWTVTVQSTTTPNGSTSSTWKWVAGIAFGALVILLVVGLIIWFSRPVIPPPYPPNQQTMYSKPTAQRGVNRNTVQQNTITPHTDALGRQYITEDGRPLYIQSSTTTTTTTPTSSASSLPPSPAMQTNIASNVVPAPGYRGSY